MKRIAILSASVRTGRLSHRVALYLENYFRQNALADTELLDLKAYDFPLFHERLAMQERPSDMLIDFTNRFNDADGLIIVSPVNSVLYYEALHKHRIPAELHIFPEGPHGFGLKTDFPYHDEMVGSLARWLREINAGKFSAVR